jgi:plasmid stabilization system protein ParE
VLKQAAVASGIDKIHAPIAVQDLRDICDFISRNNPVAAQRIGEELIKTIVSDGGLPTERPSGA